MFFLSVSRVTYKIMNGFAWKFYTRAVSLVSFVDGLYNDPTPDVLCFRKRMLAVFHVVLLFLLIALIMIMTISNIIIIYSNFTIN